MIIDKEGKAIQIEQRDVNYILPAYIISYLFQSSNEDPERIIFPLYPSVPHPRKPGEVIPIEYVPPDSPVAVEIKENGSNVAETSEEEIRRIDEKEDEIKRLKEEVARLSGATEFMPDELATFTPDEELEPPAEGAMEKIVEAVTPAPEDLIRQQEEDIEQLEDETADQQLEIDTEGVSPARAAFADEGEPPAEEEQVEEPEEEPPVAAEPEPKADAEEVPPTTPPPVPSVREPRQPPGGALPLGTPLDDMQSRGAGFERKIAQDLQPQPEVNEEEERETEIEKPKEE